MLSELRFIIIFKKNYNQSMDLSISEHAILKKVDLVYSKSESKIVLISSASSYYFKEIESIKIKKYIPSFLDKFRFWYFILIENTGHYRNNHQKVKLDYRYAKDIVINLIDGEEIRIKKTGFDLITTSKIIKKINSEINTPFKYRV